MAGDGWSAYLPVLELASHPNVVMTISDVHSRSGEEFPFRDMHSAVMMAIDAFGIDRCIWGTGYPGYLREKKGWISLADELRLVREGFDWLTVEEQEMLLGSNAERIYGFGFAAGLRQLNVGDGFRTCGPILGCRVFGCRCLLEFRL